MLGILESSQLQLLSDEDIVARVLAGETALFEIVMRRYNQRLYRVARAILHNDSEAEDVMQDAYVRAYEHLGQFAGKAQFSTWLTRIAVHEALARLHKGERFDHSGADRQQGDPMDRFSSLMPDPERHTGNSELRNFLEQAIQRLPHPYRTVFMLRDIEDMSTIDVSYALEITEETVKVRLHRARAFLRKTLLKLAGTQSTHAFDFNAVRCDRVVEGVFRKVQQSHGISSA
jgi:RNA polymerase sigma-70 factor (ECF subfamily)